MRSRHRVWVHTLQNVLQKGIQRAPACYSCGARSHQWHLVWVSVVKSTGGEAVLPPGQSSDGQSLLPMATPHSCAFTVMMTSTEHCLDPCLESVGLPLIFQSSSRGMMIL